MVSGQQHAPAALYSWGNTRYPFYRMLGGLQGRSGRAEKSRPHRDSIQDRPARSSVAIPTELPGLHLQSCKSLNFGECWLSFRSEYSDFLFHGECACYSYGCKTWRFFMRELYSLKVFEIRVLTKMFRTEGEIIQGR